MPGRAVPSCWASQDQRFTVAGVRVERSVTSITWIPSEAITALPVKAGFEMGVAHYDAPPPEQLDDLGALVAADALRFANELRGWVEVDDGRIVDFGHGGRGHIGATTLRVAGRDITFQATVLPDLRPEPQVGPGWVRFVQTAGGRTGLPMPRPVRHPPFVQFSAPLAWTTLALTIHADGTSEHELIGASPFPRHWVYDDAGVLTAKSGLIDFHRWALEAFGRHSPWGEEESPALAVAAETSLERRLSATIMSGRRKPPMRRLAPGGVLVEQGGPAGELFLLLDGVLTVEVDGKPVAEVGPGAVLGERALMEGGRRTATLRALTPCRVAVVPHDQLDPQALEELSRGHRREDSP